MSGRRVDQRYSVGHAEGVLRVLRDVTVRRGAANGFVVISTDAAGAGEVLVLERIVAGSVVGTEVRVVDSRPVLVNGCVRHQLRLAPMNSDTNDTDARADASSD